MVSSKDSREARTRSVTHLQTLLTVVVSLGVAEALQRLVRIDTVKDSYDFPDWAMFFSFFVTLVPFFHGANRYLDAAYITLESPARPAGLIADFFFLLVESMLFYLLGAFMGKLVPFYWILAALLVLDAIWVAVTFLYKEDRTRKKDNTARFNYGPWAAINIVAAFLVVLFANLTIIPDAPKISLLCLIVGARTVLDYKLSLPVYFPVPAPRN